MPHPYPTFQLIGGPLDGATDGVTFDATFVNDEVNMRINSTRPGWWLLYRGEVSFTDRPTRLEFVDWMPGEGPVTHGREAKEKADAERTVRRIIEEMQ